jgi:tRNA-guanine family transglycosylase
MLLTAHNLRYYADLMADMRCAIENARLADFAGAFAERQARAWPEPGE